jgi:hypothetical protein
MRVVNIKGNEERDDDEGMQRLSGGEEEEDDDGKYEMEGQGEVPLPKGMGLSAPLDPVPIKGLRGRTLCIFGRTNRVRRSMDRVLRYSWADFSLECGVDWPFDRWTEPIILLLIIINAVVLTIQASKPIFTPRIDTGYFKSWEDAALLILFTVFTWVNGPTS